MSQPASLDVTGIGNAIVDIIAQSDDAFLVRNAIAKGGMTLIDAAAATTLYGAMGPGIETSGGSAANTIAGVAGLGGKAAFIGKVQQDQLGEVFAHDLRTLGVQYDTPASISESPTGRCLILVTPDAQRSMSTFLGAGQELHPRDVDPATIESAQITYLEGYLWDPPHAKEAFRKAMDIAHQAGRQVAMSLSDAFCVERYRDEFQHLAAGNIDILFANESEIMSLYQTRTFDDALQAVRGKCAIAALTRSEKGCVIVAGDEVHVIEAVKPAQLIDTTGAGDLFAAGFMFGLTHGRDLAASARIGALAASEVIAHLGPRPQSDLKALLKKSGL
ncbi:MAG: adenosine kinase [Pseudomonadota bacterium]